MIKEERTYCVHQPCSRKLLACSCSRALQGCRGIARQSGRDAQCAMVQNRGEKHCTAMYRRWRNNKEERDLYPKQQKGPRLLLQTACLVTAGMARDQDMGRECRPSEE